MNQVGWPKSAACLVFLLCAATPIPLLAQTVTTLASLNGGGQPVSGVVQGTDGNFYGTTQAGGSTNNGTVFKVTPSGALTILYSFCPQPSCTDGATPKAGLVQASDGNFYGTTSGGGAAKAGTVFKITPGGTLTVLYSFCSQAGCADGTVPQAGLIQASDGNFYGTTSGGENNDSPVLTGGTVFKVTPGGIVTTLYSFCNHTLQCNDGSNSFAGLTQASDGNFYGTTWGGGANNVGTVFKVTPAGGLTTLYSFCAQTACADGAEPMSGLMQASDANLYGTTPTAGVNGDGTVFKMTPGGLLNTLYNFCPHAGCADGNGPPAGLIQASDGNFYGTTYSGGSNNGGTAFKITPGGTLTTLHSFCSQTGCADGKTVTAGLIQGTDGNFYGTTSAGGANGGGTIFRLQLANTSAPYTCATQPVISSIDSASAYGGYSYFASGSWLEIKGTNLVNPADPRLKAASPGQWTSSDFNGPNAPTALDNISVTINGKPAYVWYLSPTQLNVQAPEDSATGNVAIAVNNCTTASAPFMFARRPLAPGFLAPSNFTANGTQYMVATFASDGAYVLNTSTGAALGLNSRPAKPGDTIVGYGIGFGDVTPAILPGVIVQQSNALVNSVTVSFGSTPATLVYAGLAGNFVGLYEFYITVPPGLANGDYQINVKQHGTAVPQTMYLTVHN